MAAKDVQAREKAQSVEARHAALVGRTGTVESQVGSLQSQIGGKTDKASISHPAGQQSTQGWTGGGGLVQPGGTTHPYNTIISGYIANEFNAVGADIQNLYAAVNALINAIHS
jgi:hypothetical protein